MSRRASRSPASTFAGIHADEPAVIPAIVRAVVVMGRSMHLPEGAIIVDIGLARPTKSIEDDGTPQDRDLRG